MKYKNFNRRKFVKIAAVLSAMAYLPSCTQKTKSDKWGSVMPTRKLGKTGLDLTMFCTGGGAYNLNIPNADAILEAALNGGCRFFETARQYAKGRSEEVFGNFLEPYRNEIILMSKSTARNAENLNSDLDKSLTALKTSYLDIYLLHAVNTIDDFNERLNDGVYDAMLKAKEEGKIRHIGFSGHADFAVNNYVFDQNLPDIEVVLMPVSVIDTAINSFTLNALPKAVEKEIGVIAMKVLGGGGMLGSEITWGKDVGSKRDRVIPEVVTMREAQHFTYSMPVSSSTIGCITPEQVVENISLVESFTSMSKTEQDALIEKVAEIAKNNTLEHYKSNGYSMFKS
jgi:uncharacterized protein